MSSKKNEEEILAFFIKEILNERSPTYRRNYS